MTLPRALTWLHLLPPDTHITCGSAPAWLRDELAVRDGHRDGRRAVIEFDRSLSDVSLDGMDAFVGINCRGVRGGRLRSAGFAHVCRLAVLPSLDNPRWFVPLGSPAIASAAFNLYTPARVSARIKRLVARAAAYTRLPLWYRDQIVIARRMLSPLEQAVGQLFPDVPLAIALSSGAPEGARNRKASAAAIDPAGRVLAFLKLGESDLSRRLLRHEAQILRGMEKTGHAGEVAPRLLMQQEIDGAYVTAQSPLPGRPTGGGMSLAHLRLLDRLTAGPLCPPAQTEFVRMLPARIASAPPDHQPMLSAALEEVMPVLERQRLPAGIVHGDFAPWNLRRHKGRIIAFDWEYGALDGPAGMDEVHYRLQVGYLLGEWSVDEALRRGVTVNGPAMHAGPGVARALLVLYLVDMLARLCSEGYTAENPMLAWKLRLLARVTSGIAREAAPA